MMNEELYAKMPAWAKEKQEGHKLVVTDDIDSIATASLLYHIFGYEINGYIDRYHGYKIDPYHPADKQISVDLACVGNRKTYDNHVTLLYGNSEVNTQAVNINAVEYVSNSNYGAKYAGSTLLQVMSMYNVPLPETEEGKMFLLSIDSAYKGHFSSRFQATNHKWLRLLGYEELIEVMNRHTEQEFKDMVSVSRRKVEMTDGILQLDPTLKEWAEKYLGYEMVLPKEPMYHVGSFESRYIDTDNPEINNILNSKNMFSLAFTFKNQVSFTVIPLS